MSLLDAVHEDMNGDFGGAATCYEQAIQAGNAPFEAYLNLAVLYWQCTDYGFNATHMLDMDFIHKAGERYPVLLTEAEQRFPNHPEIIFWKLYCDYVTLGEPPFIEECERLINTANKPLVLYFYLYAAYNGRKYEEEADRLLEKCRQYPTVKNNYIISVIEGVAGRANSRRRKEMAAV